MTRRAEPDIVLQGEAGGCDAPLLRAALALSAVTGRGFRFDSLRADASPPGLDAALLACTRAAAEICRAGVEGAEPGSTALAFRPGAVRAGTYSFDTPGGTAALLHTVLLPLSFAPARSRVRLCGPTHAAGEPSFHDLAVGFLPAAERVGLGCELSLESAGPGAEPGVVHAHVFPAPRWSGLDAVQRGLLRELRAVVLSANAPAGAAMALERAVAERLRSRGLAGETEALPVPAARGRGLGLLLAALFERSTVTFFRAAGDAVPAAIAADAVDALQRFLGTRGAFDASLAAQVLLPAAVAASPWAVRGRIGAGAPSRSQFAVSEVAPELFALADAARRFLGVEVRIGGLPGREGLVAIRPQGG